MNDRSPPERPLAWEAEALWQQLEPMLPDLSVEVLARTDSTNNQVLQRLRGAAAAPAPEGARLPGRRASDTQPCLLVAEHQTAGRGRLGRSWQSRAGASLTFTLALPLSPPDWSGLSLAIGVALAEALDPLPPDGAGTPLLRLKWPNDIWLDERKLGGILIETLSVGEQRMAVIGVGLNVLPMEIGAVSTGYACLTEILPDATVPAVLHRVAPPMVQALREFERHGFAAFQARYARRDLLAGRGVRSGSTEGVAVGVGPDGALLVRTAEGEQRIVSSEVSVRTSPWDQSTLPGLPC